MQLYIETLTSRFEEYSIQYGIASVGKHVPSSTICLSFDGFSSILFLGFTNSSYLLTYDAVAFNQLLETVLTTNTPAAGSTRQNHSPWLFLDAAQEVFTVAKERVYLKEASKPQETHGEVPRGITVVLEELPKLATLKEVLEEIEHEIHLNPQNGTSFMIVLMEMTERMLLS